MGERAFRFCPRCGAGLEARELGGRERQACPDAACGFVHWDNPVPVVAAIVEHEGQVILVRNHGWPEKWLGLVSGFLEAGEHPELGVLREVREELGLDGQIVELVGLYDYAEANQVLIVYHVRCEGSVRLGEELAAYKAVAPEKLKPWPFGTGHAVRDWLGRRDP